jgi:hypothetical protein
MHGTPPKKGVDCIDPAKPNWRKELTVASSSPPVTELLQAWGAGDQSALDRLVPIVYAERRLKRGSE